MKKIFEYSDYREFLSDYYEEKKMNEGYTYRDFSEKAGMNSSSWLLHLIRGTKNLTEKSALKVCHAVEFQKNEIDYFLLLVKFTQAKNSKQKDIFYKKILSFKERLKIIHISEEQYEYYQHWYHPVVRSLVVKIPFNDDYAFLGKCLRPHISSHEAQKSVELLEKLGLIKRDELGNWSLSNESISTGDEVSSEVASLQVIHYHKQVAKLMENVFDITKKEERDISALTMGITAEDFIIIRDKIREFRKEIMEVIQKSSGGERVYQMNLQFFPVSNWNKGKENDEL